MALLEALGELVASVGLLSVMEGLPLADIDPGPVAVDEAVVVLVTVCDAVKVGVQVLLGVTLLEAVCDDVVVGEALGVTVPVPVAVLLREAVPVAVIDCCVLRRVFD